MSCSYPDERLGVENVLTIVSDMYIDLEAEENVACSKNTNNKIIILYECSKIQCDRKQELMLGT